MCEFEGLDLAFDDAAEAREFRDERKGNCRPKWPI